MFAIIAENLETNESVLIEIAQGNPEKAAESAAQKYFRAHLAAGNHILEHSGGHLELIKVDHVRGWTTNYKVKTPIARVSTIQISPALSSRMGGVVLRQHAMLRVSPRLTRCKSS